MDVGAEAFLPEGHMREGAMGLWPAEACRAGSGSKGSGSGVVWDPASEEGGETG